MVFREYRGRRYSWFSALLSGRLTGSGAIFSGQQTDPFKTTAQSIEAAAEHAGADAVAKAKADAAAIAAQALQTAVGTASPGAVVLTRNMQLTIAAAVIIAVYLIKKE